MSRVRNFSERQVEILNDLMKYLPALSSWDRGLANLDEAGLGDILSGTTQSSDLTSLTVLSVENSQGSLISLFQGDLIRSVSINVVDPFEDLGATLSIGTEENPTELVDINLSDLSAKGLYTVAPNEELKEDKEFKYFLDKGSSVSGDLDVLLTYKQKES